MRGNVNRLFSHVWLLVVLLLFVALVGCTTISEDQREYDRLDYLDAVLSPMLRSCAAARGLIVYRASIADIGVRRALDTGDYSQLTLFEMQQLECCLSSALTCVGM